MDVNGVPPSEKNPHGKSIGIDQKKIMINLFKYKPQQLLENPDSPQLTGKQMITDISKSSGIENHKIQTTLLEYTNKDTVSSPNKEKTNSTALKKIDKFYKNVIRQKIHNFWRNYEMPTIVKILKAINEDETLPKLDLSSLLKVLIDLQFYYVINNSTCVLLEETNSITLRRRYLDKVRHYRAQRKPIYYLGEMLVNAGETHSSTPIDTTVKSPGDAFLSDKTTIIKEPFEKCKQLIVLHIGSTNGFVPGGLKCFESKSNLTNLDLLDEIDADTFNDWFVKILPLLKENAVIVMDNASYHSVKKFQIPNVSWKKQEIIDWLESKGEIVIDPIIKIDLLRKVRKLRKHYDKYVIDEYALHNKKIVLRLPAYYCELNPIEHAWTSVKSYVQTHNDTFKLNDKYELLKKGIEQVTPEMWMDFVRRIMEEEEDLLNIEHIIDKLLDGQPEIRASHILTSETNDTSFSDSDTD